MTNKNRLKFIELQVLESNLKQKYFNVLAFSAIQYVSMTQVMQNSFQKAKKRYA